MPAPDWSLLARGALFVTGFALALAAWSYATWWATSRGEPLARALDRRAFTAPVFLGFVLIAAALAWGAESTWQRISGVVLGVLLSVAFARSLRS